MKEIVKNITAWLKTQSLWIKILFMMAAAALGCCIVFSSCSTLTATIPKAQNNEIGAEGVVSKEKNVSKTTKWFYLPEKELNSN